MQKAHLPALDAFRGLCVISIVMIHTTFWSGASYTPNAIQSLSLLVDVPAFFFIAGMSLALSGAVNPLNSVWKMIFFFGVCVFLYDLAECFMRLKIDFQNTLNALTLNGFNTPRFPIFGGSYWFVPVFCVVAILSTLILRFVRVRAYFIASLFLSLYLVFWVFEINLKTRFLGVNLQYALFYSGLYLLGFCFLKDKIHTLKLAAVLGLIGLCGYLLLMLYTSDTSIYTLQSHKFAPKLPYVLASLFGLGVLLFIYQGLILLQNSLETRGGGGANAIKFGVLAQNSLNFYALQGKMRYIFTSHKAFHRAYFSASHLSSNPTCTGL